MKTKRKSAEMRKKENKTTQQQCRSTSQQSQSTIRASHHRGSVIYKGAGMQCTPMAYTAVLYSTLSSSASWNTNVLDAILQQGDTVYMSYPHVYNKFQYTELPMDINIRPPQYDKPVNMTATFGDVLFGNMPQDFSNMHSMRLDDAISVACSDTSGCLFITCGYTVVVMKRCSMFYVFDSHFRDINGQTVPGGTAVLLQFASSGDVASHFHKLYGHAVGPHTQFDVIPICAKHHQEPQIHAYFSDQLKNNHNKCNQKKTIQVFSRTRYSFVEGGPVTKSIQYTTGQRMASGC